MNQGCNVVRLRLIEQGAGIRSWHVKGTSGAQQRDFIENVPSVYLLSMRTEHEVVTDPKSPGLMTTSNIVEYSILNYLDYRVKKVINKLYSLSL